MPRSSETSAIPSILLHPANRKRFVSILDRLIAEAEASEADRARMQEERRRQAESVRDEKSRAATRERCKSLAAFVREAWPVLEPVAEYHHNWHVDAICQHLEAVTDGRITRLLINVPPGSMKSLLVSVFWPAWEWAQGKTSLRYITTSFAADATTRDTRKMRDLILSDWFQALWPEVTLVRKGDTAVSNDATGYRESSAFGSLTSKRGDRLIIDDPHSVKTAESEDERNTTTRLFREGALNRLNSQEHSAIVVIMQRLHEKDISGTILSLKMGYVHLMLPMEFDPDRRCRTKIGFVDPRTRRGELLDPIRFPEHVLKQMRSDFTAYAWAGQYQQTPQPREGGMFKRRDFTIVDAIPSEAVRKVRRWDLAASIAKDGGDPDWTAGVKMSTDGRKFYVEHVERFRETGAAVRRAIRNTASADGRACEIVIPQDPGQAGKDQAESIIAENAGYVIKAERETGAKETRAEPMAAQAEAGNVCILRGDWNESFLDEMCNFPTWGHDDQFDAAAGAFNALAGIQGPMRISRDELKKIAMAGNRRMR